MLRMFWFFGSTTQLVCNFSAVALSVGVPSVNSLGKMIVLIIEKKQATNVKLVLVKLQL